MCISILAPKCFNVSDSDVDDTDSVSIDEDNDHGSVDEGRMVLVVWLMWRIKA